jgi:hypothetical protein
VKRAKNAAMSVSAAASRARVVSRADDEGAVVVTVASRSGEGGWALRGRANYT